MQMKALAAGAVALLAATICISCATSAEASDSRNDVLKREAIDWIRRFLRGDLTKTDLEEIRDKLAATDSSNGLQDAASELVQKGRAAGAGWTSRFDSHLSRMSSPCKNDIWRWLEDLLTKKMYAVKVADAFGKPPGGVTGGNLAWLGSREACWSVDKSTWELPPMSGNITESMQLAASVYVPFSGQYCVASIDGLGKFLSQDYEIPGTTILMALCVPDTCTAEDAKDVAGTVTSILGAIGIKLTAGNTYCQARRNTAPWSFGEISFFVTSCLLLLLVTAGTVYDVHRRTFSEETESEQDSEQDSAVSGSQRQLVVNAGKAKNTAPSANVVIGSFLLCFSALTNGEKILTVSGGKDKSGGVATINCLHGLRTFSILWVILGHVYGIAMNFSDNRLTYFNTFTQRFSSYAVLQGVFAVDTFFFLSGLLVAYLTLRTLYGERNTKGLRGVSWIYFYFHRLWRLTPAYMYVLLFWATIFLGRLLTGPASAITKQNEFTQGVDPKAMCEKYWWTNLLYINNIYPPKLFEDCFGLAWYLANDMQFFFISPIFLALIYKYRRVGLVALFLGVVGCCVSRGLYTHSYGIGIIITDQPTRYNPEEDGDISPFDKIYIRPWNRIAPYLVGMALGTFLAKFDKHKFHMRKSICLALWSLCAALMMTLVYSPYDTRTREGHPVPDRDTAKVLWNSLSKLGWALGLSWVVLACHTGYGGFINRFLTWKAWVPLSRITYTTYLIHILVQYHYFSNRNGPLHMGTENVIYMFIGSAVLSYGLAFLLSLLVESPLIALEKLFMTKMRAR